MYYYRNIILRSLGFDSYQEYLCSDLWQDIRYQVLSFKPRCVRCGVNASQVHHASYSKSVLLGKDFSQLRPVCADCHKFAEYEKGEKTSLVRANQRLQLFYVHPHAPLHELDLSAVVI